MTTTIRYRFGIVLSLAGAYLALTHLPYGWHFAPFDALLCVSACALSEYLWPTPDDIET